MAGLLASKVSDRGADRTDSNAVMAKSDGWTDRSILATRRSLGLATAIGQQRIDGMPDRCVSRLPLCVTNPLVERGSDSLETEKSYQRRTLLE